MNLTMPRTRRKNGGKDFCLFLQHNADDEVASSSRFVNRDIGEVLKKFIFQTKYKTTNHYDMQAHLKALFLSFTLTVLYLR